MKKNTIIKFITPAIALALVLGAAFAFGVSADESAKVPEIAGKNIVYSDTLTIQYAVPTSTADSSATLVVANENGVVGSTTWSETLTTDKVTGIEDTYYIFEVTGIPASDVCDEITVYVQSGDKKSETMTYSVAEYFFERLYQDGVIEATADKALFQKGLYLSYLEYAANAQNLFVNYGAADEDKEVLVTDRHYISVNGGNISGASAGVYLPGASVTITPDDASTKAWALTTYSFDTNGNVVKATKTVPATSPIELTANTLVAPGKVAAGDYYDVYGGYNYEGATSISSLGGQVYCQAGGYVILDNKAKETTKNRAWLSIVNDSGNTVVEHLTMSAGPKSSDAIRSFFASSVNEAEGNCLVFETKIKVVSANPAVYNSSYNNSDGSYMMTFTAAKGDTHFADIGYLYVDSEDDGENLHFHIGFAGAMYGSKQINANEWHTITMMYYSNGKSVYYVDGERYLEKTASSAFDGDFSEAVNSVGMFMRESATNSAVYFDDTFVGVIKKDYVAGE